jgi:hypothetical protein
MHFFSGLHDEFIALIKKCMQFAGCFESLAAMRPIIHYCWPSRLFRQGQISRGQNYFQYC